jgi:hypothetical protein
LGNFKDIEQRLRSNTLDAIVADFAAHAFQRKTPRIDLRCGHFRFRFLQLT